MFGLNVGKKIVTYVTRALKKRCCKCVTQQLTEFFVNKNQNWLTDFFEFHYMLFVGCTGAIRNTMEEILLKDYNFHSDFIVGMESILSLIFMLFVGIMFIYNCTCIS